MKRQLLKDLGIEAEHIDAIMAEHGKKVNEMKDNIDKLNEQLTAKTNEVNELKDNIVTLEPKAEKATSLEEEINDYREQLLTARVEKKLIEEGGKDLDYLKYKLGDLSEIEDLDKAVTDLKSEYASFFQGEQQTEKPKEPYKVLEKPLAAGDPKKPMTVEEIMKVKDTKTRHDLIKEYSDLFI